jgi:hypothetical protein
MFKVAFPGATEEEEAREMEWVKKHIRLKLINRSRGPSTPPGLTVVETLTLFD